MLLYCCFGNDLLRVHGIVHLSVLCPLCVATCTLALHCNDVLKCDDIISNTRYTLVLKFAEVAFHEEGSKIFNVVLNGKHTVVRDLDIYSKVGHAVAHDEYISFVVKGDTLK